MPAATGKRAVSTRIVASYRLVEGPQRDCIGVAARRPRQTALACEARESFSACRCSARPSCESDRCVAAEFKGLV